MPLDGEHYSIMYLMKQRRNIRCSHGNLLFYTGTLYLGIGLVTIESKESCPSNTLLVPYL